MHRKYFLYNDEAVSVTIGTTLLVAIIVILAAFVSAVAFGMVGASITSKVVGMTVATGSLSNASPTALITIHGGTDLERLISLEYAMNDTMTYRFVTDINGHIIDPGSGYPLQVGDVLATGCDSPLGKRLLIRRTFTDGSRQVLFDKNF